MADINAHLAQPGATLITERAAVLRLGGVGRDDGVPVMGRKYVY
jgi:hypothetical protein